MIVGLPNPSASSVVMSLAYTEERPKIEDSISELAVLTFNTLSYNGQGPDIGSIGVNQIVEDCERNRLAEKILASLATEESNLMAQPELNSITEEEEQRTVALRAINPSASGLGIESALERHFPTDDQQKKEIRDLLLALEKSHDNPLQAKKCFESLTVIALNCRNPILIDYLGQIFDHDWFPYEELVSLNIVNEAQAFFKTLFLKKNNWVLSPNSLQFLCRNVGKLGFQTSMGLGSVIRRLFHLASRSPEYSFPFLLKMMNLMLSHNKEHGTNLLAAAIMNCLFPLFAEKVQWLNRIEKEEIIENMAGAYKQAQEIFGCTFAGGRFLSLYAGPERGCKPSEKDFSMVMTILESDESAATYFNFFAPQFLPREFILHCLDKGIERYTVNEHSKNKILLKSLLKLMAAFLLKSSDDRERKVVIFKHFLCEVFKHIENKEQSEKISVSKVLLGFFKVCKELPLHQNKEFSAEVQYFEWVLSVIPNRTF